MLERYWAWNYEIKDLGLWPGEGYKGHNMPVEVVKAEDAQATIADLQGQVEVAQKQLKFLGATMQPDGMVSLDLKKYHAAHRCKAHREDPWQDIDTEIDCFVCLKQRVAQLERERDDALHAAQGMSNDLTALGQKYEAELDTLQADHARVLGLVQEVVNAGVSMEDPRIAYKEVQIDREWFDRAAATLPAQPAQGEVVDSIKDRELDHGRDDWKA